ncbi:MAG: hypothetical protein ACQEQG_04445 [Bacillota bacterium]
MFKKFIVLSILLIFIVIGTSVTTYAWNPRLDTAHYVIRARTTEIEALQFELGFTLDRINTLKTLFVYTGEDFDLQPSWLVNFVNEENLSLDLRLNIATDLADRSFLPSLGLEGEIGMGTNNKLFGHLDYLFNQASSQFVYEIGMDFPITTNSSLTIAFGNGFWDRKTNTIGAGLKVGF